MKVFPFRTGWGFCLAWVCLYSPAVLVNLHCQQENGGLLLENLLGILTHAWEYGLSHASEFEQALGDHLVLVGTALGISILLCIPLGIWTARSRLASLTIMNLINALRVIPAWQCCFS
jgi:ABC-type nitrate/sulfonate/bicarbonate transport system permease component